MSEILFRGKMLNCAGWIFGSYVHFDLCKVSCAQIKKDLVEDYIIVGLDSHGAVKMGDVWPHTVGQFTGLTDRNGVKIFEGDIVKYTTGLGYSHICTVTYSPPYAQFQLNFVRSGESTHFMRCSGSDCEVLGNIYDNPELLGVNNDE